MIGVLGGGQLGRMLALAGTPLGERFLFLDPTADGPASHVGEQLAFAYDDRSIGHQVQQRGRGRGQKIEIGETRSFGRSSDGQKRSGVFLPGLCLIMDLHASGFSQFPLVIFAGFS